MHELVVNLHIHSVYSDGNATHNEILSTASQAGIDVVIVTDHNLLVQGVESYHKSSNRLTLLLTGEEVHNRSSAHNHKGHLLVFNAGQEMSAYGSHPRRLIQQISLAGGMSFIAHPFESAMPEFHEGAYSWGDWDVRGFTGLEIWNGLSELKSNGRPPWRALLYALVPQLLARAPYPETIQKWDELTAAGQTVVAIGGSDAHAMTKHFGIFSRVIFPYAYHFQAINTHILCPQPLSGDLDADQAMIYDALRQGHAFVGYDLPFSTRGFRFTAQGVQGTALMGDHMRINGSSVTLQVRLPVRAHCRLLRNGKVIYKWKNRESFAHITNQPGVYRLEASLPYLGRRRNWIYSNPIYLSA